jgi:hypothetical protein
VAYSGSVRGVVVGMLLHCLIRGLRMVRDDVKVVEYHLAELNSSKEWNDVVAGRCETCIRDDEVVCGCPLLVVCSWF